MRTFFILAALVLLGFLVYTNIQPRESIPSEDTTPVYEHALIRVTSPEPEGVVVSPLNVSGEARGYWFFEATAPVVVVDWDGLILGEGYIQTTENWMTEEFVPFVGTIEFDTSQISNNYSQKGTLIFKKQNASGLPEHEDAFEIPIVFEN